MNRRFQGMPKTPQPGRMLRYSSFESKPYERPGLAIPAARGSRQPTNVLDYTRECKQIPNGFEVGAADIDETAINEMGQ